MSWFNPRTWFSRAGTVEVLNPRGRKIDAWAAYTGDFPLVLSKSGVDPQGDDNVRIPLVAEIANVSVNHEIGAEGPSILVAGEGGEAAQAYLDDFLKRSKFPVLVRKAALHGAFAGHRFLKLIVENGKPSRIQVVPSASVSIANDPRDQDKVNEYTISWMEGDDEHRERIQRRTDGRTGWLIFQEVRRKGQGNWVLDGDAGPSYNC